MSTASDFRVTLLGTGTPIPRPDRFGPSTLIEAGDQKLLIDAERGATIRLYQLSVIGRIAVRSRRAVDRGHARTKALGIAVPPALLAHTDEVIEYVPETAVRCAA